LTASAAPSRSHAAHFSAEPAVTSTAAPISTPSWIAVMPMPLLPPCTNAVCPARSPPMSNRLAHTVKKFSGSAAARTAS